MIGNTDTILVHENEKYSLYFNSVVRLVIKYHKTESGIKDMG